MSIVSSYLNQTVTWERVTGRDEWGAPTVETSTVPARVEPSNRLIRNKEGQEVVSRAKVTTEAAVNAGDWLTLPDGTRQQVLDVRVYVGLGSEEYREVFL